MANDIDKVLAHAVQHKLNVLLKGKHGVGKTAMVQQCFDEAGLKWKYYSASTMDPWVDFIGVPKEKTDKDGNTYLDLVRPKELALDEVEAIFFDELNRSHKKIRNAVMELIQFKSINGKPFKNLKIVWAAINPDDEEHTYDVERLDPAQVDRFQIHIDVPNEPNSRYFKAKFGPQGERAVKWWKTLKKEIQDLVSPRRLDYALQIINAGGDVRCVLDPKTNITEFITTMSKGDPLEICNKLLGQNPTDISRYLMNNNDYKHVRSKIFEEERLMRGLARYIPTDTLISELLPKATASHKLQQHVAHNPEMFDHLTDAILANSKSYGELLVKAFEAHRRKKATNEKNALSNAQSLMDRLTNQPTVRPAQNLMINGKAFRIGDLTVDNYESQTGRRFRMTAVQSEQVRQNKLTREDAFKEYIENLTKRSQPNS